MFVVFGPPAFVIGFIAAALILRAIAGMASTGHGRLLVVIGLSLIAVPAMVAGAMALAWPDHPVLNGFALAFALGGPIAWGGICLWILRRTQTAPTFPAR